jgi:hypothetical protein
MDIQIKQRLYITTVVATLIWLLCMGVVNLVHVQDIRASALSECLKDNFQLFELCYKKTNDEISPTLLNYLSPFIPVTILLWISWVLKLKFQFETQDTPSKLRKSFVFLLYLIGVLGIFFPFYIVAEKEVERLYAVSLYNLFLMPWLAISWISIPVFFKKLLDAENKIAEFKYLIKVIYCVAASPFLAVICLLLRQAFKF